MFELYSKIGINQEVIKRGEFSDLLTQSRQWNDKEREILMNSINESYIAFKQRVIDGREKLNDINELDDIALGRIWSGNEAKNNGSLLPITELIDNYYGEVQKLGGNRWDTSSLIKRFRK